MRDGMRKIGKSKCILLVTMIFVVFFVIYFYYVHIVGITLFKKNLINDYLKRYNGHFEILREVRENLFGSFVSVGSFDCRVCYVYDKKNDIEFYIAYGVGWFGGIVQESAFDTYYEVLYEKKFCGEFEQFFNNNYCNGEFEIVCGNWWETPDANTMINNISLGIMFYIYLEPKDYGFTELLEKNVKNIMNYLGKYMYLTIEKNI